MKQKHYACYRTDVSMGQHPVAQSGGEPPINLLAKWIRHHDSDTEKSHKSGEPTHCQPTTDEYLVKAVSLKPPNDLEHREDYCDRSADVPGTCKRIVLVNISP